MPLLSPLPQDPAVWFTWTYVWLALVGLVLVLGAATLAYLTARRHAERLVDHPALRRLDRTLARRTPRLWAWMRRRLTPGAWHGLELTAGTVIVTVGLALFILIGEAWIDEAALYALDWQLYAWLQQAMPPWMLAFMEAVTRLGDREVMIAMSVATGLFLLARRHYWRIVTLVLAPGVGSLLVVGLKAAYGRLRPELQVTPVTGHSFPSGHAFAAMSLFGFLIYLTWRLARRDVVRIPATLVLVVLIVLVGLSRVVLRVHWFTDVLGGFTLALAWLVASIVLVRTARALLVKPSR